MTTAKETYRLNWFSYHHNLVGYFLAKIRSIPHPSYHEEQLRGIVVSWAKEKGLYVCDRDRSR